MMPDVMGRNAAGGFAAEDFDRGAIIPDPEAVASEEESPRPAVEPWAEMSIEIFRERHLRSLLSFDAPSITGSKAPGASPGIANSVIRRIGAEASVCSTSSR
jgi:hypothetical protein